MIKSNKIEHEHHIDESVEHILENKSGWTQYTTWAREKYHINNRQANDMWKNAWKVINTLFEENIQQSVNEALVSLERLEQMALEENDRRTLLEIIKYRNKIRGGEVERHHHEIKGNLTINVNFSDNSTF
ncbi:hypothetical protein [Shewanella sp.]|uniref:hypothetical protein n=1 Tax=Shewanella sp. TaxID=50422 RepID=UPI00404730C9